MSVVRARALRRHGAELEERVMAEAEAVGALPCLRQETFDFITSVVMEMASVRRTRR